MVDKHLFADLATQYYVAGRQGARAALIPVHGNLLHHAIEMYLKAALLGTLTLEQMKRTPYSHDLTALWKEFKKKVGDPALAGFDGTVKALHAFEVIRYPEKIAEMGMVATVAWGPSPTVASVGGPPTYEVVISEVDALVLQVLRRASINPKPLLGIHTVRRDAILHRNLRADDWI
jgi:hypothetical protein